MSFASPFPEVDIPSTSIYDYLFGSVDDSRPRPCRARRHRVGQGAHLPRNDRPHRPIRGCAGRARHRGRRRRRHAVAQQFRIRRRLPRHPAVRRDGHDVNVLFTAKDIAKQLTDSNAKMLVTVSALLAPAEEAAAAVGLAPDALARPRRRGSGRQRTSERRADLLALGAASTRSEFRAVLAFGGAALQFWNDGKPQRA